MTVSSRVYLDTAPIVYYLNMHDRYFSCVENFFSQNRARFFSSTLTEMEYLIVPYRNRDKEQIDEFRMFVASMPLNIQTVTREISDKAAQIRAAYPHFKAIDALHLATACLCECDVFFTNDKQLRQFTEIECLLVDDLLDNAF